MIDTETLAETTVERLAEADVIMAVGFGDPHASKVLLGRLRFVSAAANPETALETNILRVKIVSHEELEELKRQVKQAKGELDPDVE